MYVDLLSQYNYIMVNVKVASVLGLQCATYWAELMNVYPRVISKKKDELLGSDGFFELDREYVERRTTLTAEEQLAMDSALARLGMLSSDPENPNRIRIDPERMAALILEDDPAALKDVWKKSKLKRGDKAQAKREAIRRNLLAAVSEPDEDVLAAMRTWIDALVDAKKFVSKTVVEVFQNGMDSYTSDKSEKLKLLEIAAVHAWPDFAWARNAFEKDYGGRRATFVGMPQKQSVGIDPDSGF